MIVEKDGYSAVLKVVVDPAVEVPRFAAMLRYHENSPDIIGSLREEPPARVVVVEHRVDLAGEGHKRICPAHIGRAEHVPLERLQGLQDLWRFHGVFRFALDDDVEVIRSLEFFVDMSDADVIVGIGPEQGRSRSRIAHSEELIPINAPECDGGKES